MSQLTVFDVIELKIKDSLVAAREHLCNGGAKDFAEYRETCGFIRGLETAQREVKDLARNFLEEDEDD